MNYYLRDHVVLGGEKICLNRPLGDPFDKLRASAISG